MYFFVTQTILQWPMSIAKLRSKSNLKQHQIYDIISTHKRTLVIEKARSWTKGRCLYTIPAYGLLLQGHWLFRDLLRSN